MQSNMFDGVVCMVERLEDVFQKPSHLVHKDPSIETTAPSSTRVPTVQLLQRFALSMPHQAIMEGGQAKRGSFPFYC